MYGYVRPLKAELKVREWEQYRAAYCGLCHALGKRYGLPARFLVNYDLTFLYCLFTACDPAPGTQKCFCPANPLCKKRCARPGEAMDAAADLCVLLGWFKLSDGVRDHRGPKRWGAWLARLLLKPAFRKASRLRPGACQGMKTHLGRLEALERESCPELDPPAGEFAAILQSWSGFWPDPALSRPAEQLLYHLGRFVYLCDAWDDLARDCRQGSYNPIALRFGASEGALTPEAKQQLHTTLSHSVRLCAAALELLPLEGGKGLVENIIYLGLPAVLDSIAAGTFHTKKDRSTL